MEAFFEIIHGELVKYTGSDRQVTVPPVVSVCESAFYLNDTVEVVVLPEGIEIIKNWAFGYCTSLKTVLIPASVKEIAPNAFDGCSALEAVAVSKDNPYFCSVNGVLFNKTQKKLVLFPRNCGMYSYAVPDGVEEICDNSFNRCFGLKEIHLPESVTSIGYKAFGYCTGLQRVFLPKSIENIGYCAFASATSIEQFSVDAHSGKFRSIDGVLFDISGHKLIQFPLGRKTDSFVIDRTVLSIEERAFSDSHLSSITVDDESLFFAAVNGCLFSRDLSALMCYPPQKEDAFFRIPEGVIKICNSAFKNNKHLKEIVLPGTLEQIDRHAFEYCDRLKTVTSGICNLRELGWASFSDCISLENADFSNTNLTIIQGHAFFNCKKLKFISSGKVESIGFDAFGASVR